MIHYFEQVGSTNDEATNPLYGEGDVIWAESQTCGRGQRGHKWISGQGLNITFTLVLKPSFLPAANQFLLSEVAASGVADCLADYGIEARIKWTNDIYVGDGKICGMLIENKLMGGAIDRSIVGIGLNVNQDEFDGALPNPVSMKQLTGRNFDRRDLLENLIRCIMCRYEALRAEYVTCCVAAESLRRDYHGRLYRLDEEHWYALPDGERFRGTIRGVEPSGALLVENGLGEVVSYVFKEIEFVLK